MQETPVQFLGWEDPLEKEMATHSSVLAWRILWTEESSGLQFMGPQRIGHDWVSNTFRALVGNCPLSSGGDGFSCLQKAPPLRSMRWELPWPCQEAHPRGKAVTLTPGFWYLYCQLSLLTSLFCEKVKVTQSCPTLWPCTVAYQGPLSMEFSRQEYWSGCLFPSSGESSQPRDRIWVSCIAGRFFTIRATT